MEKQHASEYRCEVCGATLYDPDALVKHRKEEHRDEEKEEGKKELEQGMSPPMGAPGLSPAGGNIPIR